MASRWTMGMPVAVEGLDDALTARVFDWFDHVDLVFSPYRAESWVGRVQQGVADASGEDDETREVASLCRVFAAETEGCFTCSPGGRFDPSGLVKGWAIERAGELVEASGSGGSWWIDAGGDVLVRGSVPRRVGIRHPVELESVARVIEVTSGAVCTSGTYLQGAHIVDPREPGRELELVSFTVVGPSVMAADVYATACFVMGADAGLRFLAARGYDGYAVDRSLRARATDGFLRRCVPA